VNGSQSQYPPREPRAAAFSLDEQAFLLDVDGTILDIAQTPEEVIVPEAVKHTLARLQAKTGGATALVSGRAITTLDALFAPLVLAAAGCHGGEWRLQPDRPIEHRSQPLHPEVRQILLSAIADTPQVRVEDKNYALAFHYRGAPKLGPVLEARLGAAILPRESKLRLLRGKFVLEVQPRGFDKGEVIHTLMRHAPFASRRPIFLGDDTTDEDAFAAVRELGGVGISVGQSMAHAEYMFPDPQAARDWLAALTVTELKQDRERR
jgi:trehalose 6-phosphate phosphatase